VWSLIESSTTRKVLQRGNFQLRDSRWSGMIPEVLVYQMNEKLSLGSRVLSRPATRHRTTSSYRGLPVLHVGLEAGDLSLELAKLILRRFDALWLVDAVDVLSFRIISPKVAQSAALVVKVVLQRYMRDVNATCVETAV
jgi:hypothetical protein